MAWKCFRQISAWPLPIKFGARTFSGHVWKEDPFFKPAARGKIAELQKVAKTLPISGVFINTPKLTPFQHEALEELFEKDVFDRFGIVLKIFKERARTHEAKIQVELAEIPYLSHDWQLMLLTLTTRKVEVGTQLCTLPNKTLQTGENVKREAGGVTKEVSCNRNTTYEAPQSAHCGSRWIHKCREDHISESTIRDEAMQPKDMLFATLDTTMHSGKLPSGMKVLYLDTIGFISELPHELIESFQSTLEEVIHADLIVHIRDASHPLAMLRKTACPLPEGPRAELHVSATKGQGIQELQCRIEAAVMRITNQKLWKVIVPASSAALRFVNFLV
eukprot:Em0438g7a